MRSVACTGTEIFGTIGGYSSGTTSTKAEPLGTVNRD